MNVSELFNGQEIKVRGKFIPISTLVYDSRMVKSGSLFAAWEGVCSDGHDFIPDAIAAGASCILCECDVDTGDVPRIVVPNARLAFALAARRFFDNPSSKLRTIGITGTNGKTTLAHLIVEILRAGGLEPGMVGTLGATYLGETVHTGMTTPESVELLKLLKDMVDSGVTGAAMEVSSHALSQYRVAGVDFDVGVFTNLTQDHLDYHKSEEEYFKAKASLLRKHLKPSGVAVLNLDDSRVATLRTEDALCFSVRGDSDAEICLRSQKLSARKTIVEIQTPKGLCCVTSSLVGDFNVQNILGAVAVGVALDIELEKIAFGIESVKSIPGRLECINRGGGEGLPLVLVDYAHTPDALEKALQSVRDITVGRLICVFGCGGERDVSKRALMGKAAMNNADWVVLTNDNPRREDPMQIAELVLEGIQAAGGCMGELDLSGGYALELDRAKAIALAIHAAGQEDCVLIAGKGHEEHQIIGTEKRRFDDRLQATLVLEELRKQKGCK